MNKATELTKATVTVPTDWSVKATALSEAIEDLTVYVSESELSTNDIIELSGGDDVTATTFTNMFNLLRKTYEDREKSETLFLIMLAYTVSKVEESDAKDTKTVIVRAIPDLSDSYSNYLKAVKSLTTYGKNADVVKYLASFGITKLKAIYNKDKTETILEKLKSGDINPTMTVKQISEAINPPSLVRQTTNTTTNTTNTTTNTNTNVEEAKAEAEAAKAEAAKAEAAAIAAKAEAEAKGKEAEAKAEAAKKEAADAKAEAEAAKKMTFDKVVNFINKCNDATMLTELLKVIQTKVNKIAK